MFDTTPIVNKSDGGPAALQCKTTPEPQLDEPGTSSYLPLQLKLSVGAADDPLEHEADAMADKVMRMPETSFIQCKSSCSCGDRDDEHVRLKPLASQITPFIQAKGDGAGTVSDSVSSRIKSSMGGGSSMQSDTKSFMESRFGADFSNVKIHTGNEPEQLNRSLNAKAFTVSNNIYFNSGQYQPETDSGKHLLAHELTHVVQQSPFALTGSGGDNEIQLKGGTPGGFFSNLGRGIVSIFTDEPDFSDATIQKYLEILDSGEIEDDYDSDDKARIVVRHWMAKTLPLSQQRKLMLIREMLSGATLDDDERAILNLLKNSPDDEVGFILGMVKREELEDKINGEEHDELEAILADLAKRKVQIGPAAVKDVGSKRMDKITLLGDGKANKGIIVRDFQDYISKQADWYTEPTLNPDDRERLWNIAVTMQKNNYFASALGEVLLDELRAAINTPDMAFINTYAEGANPAAQTIRITAPHNTIAKVIELGKAMTELAAFVPGVVLRICFEQVHFIKLVDDKLIPVLKSYYKDFSPSIETAKEAEPLIVLLSGDLNPFKDLKDWVHDLHVFTVKTREQLAVNITKKKEKRPVMLILMSGLDHNGAFLQKKNLEEAVTNNKNLALIIQGATSLQDEITKLDKVADDYGQVPPKGGKPRLGQVVIAGHGLDTSVQQVTKGTGAKVGGEDEYVRYDEKDLEFGKADGDSEKLIDEALQRMDPNDARIVFAGCLVGSHDIAEADITSTKTAAAEINNSIKAHPNLRDQVNARMAALNIKGRVEAANASTQFRSFTLDGKGKGKLGFTEDPDIGGTKDEYVKTGMEPEGALKAALETWADPKFGPTWTTIEMKKHVTKFAADKRWWQAITRTAFELALPAKGDVDPLVINDLAHRVGSWLDVLWETSADPNSLNNDVKANEAAILYPVMLSSINGKQPHLALVVQEAWMQLDPSHETDFINALDTTSLTRLKLSRYININDALIIKHLPKLLVTPIPSKPSKGQLLLALSMAVIKGTNMPAEVKTLLINAAGGAKTSKFPPALKVSSLLDGISELTILQDIGLAPGSGPSAVANATPDDANLDIDDNKKNDTYVSVQPRKATLAFPLLVQSLPNQQPESKIIARLVKGDDVNIVGTTNGWTVIDLNGKTGFVLYNFP